MLGVVFVLAIALISPPAAAQTPPDTSGAAGRYTFTADAPLPDALDRLMAKTGVELVYATDLVAGKTAHCHVENATAAEVLGCLLLGTGVSAEPRGPDRFVLVTRPADASHILSGFVVDAASGEALVGANLYVPALRRGTSTNQEGFYSLTLPADSVRLVSSYLGYERKVIPLKLQSDRRRTIELSPSAVQAGSLEVTAEQAPLQQTTRTSTVEITAKRAKQNPTLLGQTDVLKTLQLLPGVQSGNEGTSGLYVRGGTPDQNQILLDGAPLYNVSHLFGFLSVFNPDIIQNVRLTKGGFPARYGGHLSSVVEVSTEDGNRKSYDVEGSLGLVASRLTVQGPIGGDDTSFLIAGRRTYADWLARASSEDDLDGGYYFYDVNAKLNHRFSSSDRLAFSLYTGDDKYYNREDDGSSLTEMAWGNLTSTLQWNHVFDSQLFGSATLRYSRYQFEVDAESNVEDGRYRLRYRSGIRDVGLKANLDYDPSPRHSIRTGIDLTHHRFRPGATQYRDERGSEVALDTTIAPSDPVRALDASVYVEDDVTWSDRFKTNLGLRATGFFVEGTSYLSLQPRLSARYLLPSGWALKGSYAWMYQPIHLLTNSSVGLPTDLWVSSTAEVPPEQAHQVTLGLARSFRDREYEVRLEGYGKLMRGLIEYEQGAAFSLATDTNWEEQVQTGRGWSYGAEVLLRRTRGQTTGWLSYTLSWTRRQFDALNGGKPFPFRYDRRHDLTATATHQLTGVTSVSATWTYRSGTAVTLPKARYRVPEPGPRGSFSGIAFNGPRTVKAYGERNGYRMRPYHRLDLGVSFEWGDRSGLHALKVGTYNTYNRKNPYFLQTEQASNGALQAKATSLLPTVPYLNYRFRF
jgi:hypothetical protein